MTAAAATASTNCCTHTRTHTHPGSPFVVFTEARDSEWQWHQLGHMQIYTSLQADNHASTPPLRFFTGRMPFLPPNQQRQSTEASRLAAATATNRNDDQPIVSSCSTVYAHAPFLILCRYTTCVRASICILYCCLRWSRGTVAERRSLTGELDR